MIPLGARVTPAKWTISSRDIWRVVSGDGVVGPSDAVWLSDSAPIPEAGLYLSTRPELIGPGPTLHLPESLHHIAAGDVLAVSPDGRRVSVVWKAMATHNSVLLTERCDNYCIMCSQPPKERDDSFLYERARRIVDVLPLGARSISLTGGEPTVDSAAFLNLLRHIAVTRSDLAVHVLSNGRRFADKSFARDYSSIGLADAMVGIPLYGAESALHDYVVQSRGAFDETVRGILTLAHAGARIELRVVVQKETVPALAEIAHFIVRNLPFVDQVALMGLEMTGLAKPNSSLVWIDPYDYRQELLEAYRVLDGSKIRTRIYNHQLCVIEPELWPAAVQSISEWKNDFPEMCTPCALKEQCAGVFTTSGSRLSTHLAPVLTA